MKLIEMLIDALIYAYRSGNQEQAAAVKLGADRLIEAIRNRQSSDDAAREAEQARQWERVKTEP